MFAFSLNSTYLSTSVSGNRPIINPSLSLPISVHFHTCKYFFISFLSVSLFATDTSPLSTSSTLAGVEAVGFLGSGVRAYGLVLLFLNLGPGTIRTGPAAAVARQKQGHPPPVKERGNLSDFERRCNSQGGIWKRKPLLRA